MREVLLIKLGGSLLTDKSRAETARPETIRRLAREIRELTGAREEAVIVGHGSGSFGHVAARRFRIAEGLSSPDQVAGISLTQERAAELHRRVLEELRSAGAAPFSIAPSSAFVAADGLPAATHLEPLALALDAGLLPVIYGDVVLDRERGCTIFSTETVFRVLVGGLGAFGYCVRRVFWLGETAGILNADGATVERVTRANVDEVRRLAGGAAGTDVTGGMAHRLDVALDLAGRGVSSWILDGTRPGVLAGAAVTGEPGPPAFATLVEALPGDGA